MSMIIFKPDFSSFCKEIHEVAYVSISSKSDQYFTNTVAVLSGWNKEDRPIQLRVNVAQSIAYDESAAKKAFDEAKEIVIGWEVALKSNGIECREGLMSSAETLAEGRG